MDMWIVHMIFEEHQEEVKSYTVTEGIGYYDHIIAWYALWRKWPIQYEGWEWAAWLYNDVEDKSLIPEIGFSSVYKEWWEYVQTEKPDMYPLRDNMVYWDWDIHVDYWEKEGTRLNETGNLPDMYQIARERQDQEEE